MSILFLVYCNHRPFQGILYKDVESAFNILTNANVGNKDKCAELLNSHETTIQEKPTITMEELFLTLQNSGEL